MSLEKRNKGSPCNSSNVHTATVQTLFGLHRNNLFNRGTVIKSIMNSFPDSSKQKVRNFLDTLLSEEQIVLEPSNTPLSVVLSTYDPNYLLSEEDYKRIREARKERKNRRNRNNVEKRKERLKIQTSSEDTSDFNFDRLFYKALKANGFEKNKKKNKNNSQVYTESGIADWTPFRPHHVETARGRLAHNVVVTVNYIHFFDLCYKLFTVGSKMRKMKKQGKLKGGLHFSINYWLNVARSVGFSRAALHLTSYASFTYFGSRQGRLLTGNLLQLYNDLINWSRRHQNQQAMEEFDNLRSILVQVFGDPGYIVREFLTVNLYPEAPNIFAESLFDHVPQLPVPDHDALQRLLTDRLFGEHGWLFNYDQTVHFVSPAIMLYTYLTYKRKESGIYTIKENVEFFVVLSLRVLLVTLTRQLIVNGMKSDFAEQTFQRFRQILTDHNEHVRINEIHLPAEMRPGVFRELFNYLNSFIPGDIFTESLSEQLQEISSFWNIILSSEIISLFRDVFLFLVGKKVFSKDFSKTIIQQLGKPERMDLLSSITYLLEILQRITQFGEDAYANGIRAALQKEADPSGRLVAMTKEVLYFSDKLNHGLPVEGRMDRVIYYNTCKELLEECRYALSKGSFHSIDDKKRLLEKCISDLRQAIFDVESAQSAENRPFPFGLVIHGVPGVGKSQILTYNCRLWSSVKGREFDDKQIYHKILASEYDEGYFPAGQPYVHFSELGNLHDNIVSKTIDQSLKSLSSWMDNCPFPVNRAFNDKGKVYATPEMVVIDTNEKTLQAHKQLKHPFAVWRRFLFLNVSVRPEFRLPGSCMLDPVKSLRAGGNKLDRYTYTVSRYLNDNKEEVIFKTRSVEEYTAWMRRYMTNFIEVQEKTKNVGNEQPIFESGANDQQRLSWKDRVLYWYTMIKFFLVYSLFGSFDSQFKGFYNYIKYGFELSVYTIYELVFYHWYWCFFPGESLRFGNLNITLSRYGLFLFVLVNFFFSLGWYGPAYFALLLFVMTIPDYRTMLKQSTFDKVSHYCKLKRRYVTDRLNYLKGKIILNPYISPQGIQYFVFISGLLSIIYFLRKTFKSGNISSEATSKFHKDSYYNEKLNSLEKLVGSENLPEIIENKIVPNTWNVVEPMTKSPVFSGKPDDLVKLSMSNLRRIRVKDDYTTTIYCLGIKSSYAICNTHMFAKYSFPVVIEVLKGFDSSVVATEHIISENDIVNLGQDVSLINVRGLMFKNISHHLISGPRGISEGYLGKNKVILEPISNITITDANTKKDFAVNQCFKYHNPDHVPGLCGFPIIGNHGNCYSIVAIHMAGRSNSPDSYATFLDSKLINDGLRTLESKQGFMPIFSEGGLEEEFELPCSKSVFRHEFLPHVRYLGKEKGKVILPTPSRLQRNKFKLLEKKIKDYFNVNTEDPFIKPMMRSSTIRGEYVSPINTNMLKVNKKKKPIDPDMLKFCIEKCVDHVVKGLKERGVSQICPTTFEEVINGSFQNSYFRRLNTSTAAGHGYKGKKKDHIPIVSYVDNRPIREPSEELKKDIDSIISSYKNQEASHPVFRMLFKDEPRLRSKVEKGKTRAFYSSPLPFLILCKMFLGPFFCIMTQHRDLFKTSVGIKIYKEAGQLVSELMRVSDKVSEGDYEGFDTSMPFDLRMAANTVIYEICKRMGYNDHALQMVQGLLTDSSFPVLNLLLDYFVVPGIQPSGDAYTTEKNSVILLLIFMLAFYMVPENRELDFFKEMGLTTNGDDSNSSKSARVKEMTSHYMKKFSEDILGMKFTSSDKSDAVTGELDILDCTYLKRQFKQVDGHWIAVLDPKSIHRSICWTMPSNEIPRLQQHIQTFASALYEIYLHTLNETEFNDFRGVMIQELNNCYGLGNYNDFLPSFQEVHETINFRNEEFTKRQDPPTVLDA